MTRKAWLWTFLIACVVWPATVVLTATAVAAQEITLSFTTDANVGISGKPNDLYHVAGGSVPANLRGSECWVTADVANNDSVRSGTNIVVSSGGVNLELFDVEAVKGDAPAKDLGSLTLGEFVNVWVRFGPKGEASVDASIHVNCPDSPPPPPDEPTCLIESCDTTPPPVDPPKPPHAVVNTPRFTG